MSIILHGDGLLGNMIGTVYGGQVKMAIRKYPPGSMGIAEGRLFVGQVFSEFLLVIDIETQSIVKRLHIPGGGEGEITVSPDEKTIFFASNKENQFYVIDSATYKFDTIPYPPGGRGCMSISAHPNGLFLYIGIQRGGALNGRTYYGGNCFLAIYDLNRKSYFAAIYLAEIHNDRSDDATPACIEVDPDGARIYIGMHQSKRGICVVDTNSNQIVNDIRFRKNKHNKHYDWVDPLSVKIFKKYLLSLNRNNCELVVIDKMDYKKIKSFYLGSAANGPRDIELFDDEVVISYPEKNGLIFLNLESIALNKSLQSAANASAKVRR
jgi:DNA-binding beta-propeller fold protein YncE